MMKSSSIALYKVISVVSCLVLSMVQFFLIYNTYKLKDEHYFLAERQVINNEYAQSIRNDKLFPGGAAIIDKYINPNYDWLEYLYKHHPDLFASYSRQLCSHIFTELTAKNNMDSLLRVFKTRYHFDDQSVYAITVNALDVAFESNQYVPLYVASRHQANHATDTDSGYYIGGTLTQLSQQNSVTNITVSSPLSRSYRLIFHLHLDTPNRFASILRQMLPTLLLSLISILAVVVLFYITFKNWIRQKKIADMKSDFVNSITHEFNTPLSAIIVANKSLQNEKVIDNKEKIGQLTEVIKRQSARLQTLIGQVLNVTTMNHLQLNKQPSEIHHLLDDLLLDYRLKLTDSNIVFTLETCATEDNAEVDLFWFTTLLTNLFDNAIKYNVSEQKCITVATAINAAGEFVLTVSDNGIGMEKEVLKQSFEKFYREAGVLKHSEGLGLGLYYVKCSVMAHKWKIDVETKPGNGTRFYIVIPLKKKSNEVQNSLCRR